MKLLVVTGTGLRHRIFLSLLKREIGAYWTNTLIQGTEKAFIESSAINDDKARNTFFNCGSHFYRRARRHILCAQLKDIPLEKYLFDGKEDHFESKMIDMLQEGLSPIEPDKVSSPMYAEDPNTDGVYSWLNISKPDLIIIFGGRILKGPWLTTARLGAMNMHYGYLPHYRSSSSIQFALFHERFDLVGPTIHYIDAGIDTGPIIRRSVVKINPPEALSSVLANVYMTGITNLIDCAKKSIDNESRLPSEQMNAESSYYPSKMASPVINRVAQLRVKISSDSWPLIQNSISGALREKRKKTEILRKLFPKKHTYPPGVYIFLYHSVVDPQNANVWENSYKKVSVSIENFRSHLNYLMENMTPVKLAGAPAILSRGPADKAYFAVTFDDAYKNIFSNARPVFKEHGVSPAVFVNGAFASGKAYYRAIISLLISKGHTDELARKLQDVFPEMALSSEPANLFAVMKNFDALQKYKAVEKVVFNLYERTVGPLKDSEIHLTVDEVKALQSEGWEVGSHTYSHWPLELCDRQTISEQFDHNMKFWESAGIPLINWISYPNGRARDVSANVKSWMDQHPDMFGIFADEGVNMIPSRTEWLRICPGDISVIDFEKQIHMSLIATKLTLSDLTLLN